MASLRTISARLLLATLLSNIALAAPAPYRIKPRDVVTNVVTETVWTTVGATTTVYEDGSPVEASSAAVTEASVLALGPVERPDDSPPAAQTTAPVPVPVPAAPAPAAVSPSPGQFAETSAPPPPPAPSPPPQSTEPAPAPAADAPEVETSGGSPSGDCSGPGSSCVGEVTWYEGGLGACGTNVETASENAVALPVGFMGALSNSNPYCGKTINVKSPSGKIVKGTVKDKCMGCEARAIDLTDKMFKEVTDGKGDGRESGFEWWLD